MAKLNDRQDLFCKEYIIDLNATQAAIRAGYSEKTAYSMGQRLLKNVEVQKRIQQLMNKRSKRTEITADRVLQELALIAFSDATDYVQVVTKPLVIDGETALDSNGFPILIQQVELAETENLTHEQKMVIAGIKQGRNGIELKLHDKEKALEMIGRHLGMFNDKMEVSGNLNNPFEGLTTEELKKMVGDG